MIQSTVTMSMTKVEYTAAAETAKEALWLTGLVRKLGIQPSGVPLYCDSQSVIYLLLEKIYTSENAAYMLMKPITADKFKHCLYLTNVSRC
jgi:hypothetical protein